MRPDVIGIQNYTLYLDNEFRYLRQFISSKSYTDYVVISDEHTNRLCLPLLKDALPANVKHIVVLAGENHKNLEACQSIWGELVSQHVDRKALIILLGGGVVGDMGGFAASCYKRGTDFVHIPTTLMAMTDSSIGGKLGVDFQHIKNAVGVFEQPRAIFLHLPFLKTLPESELRSGFVEMIKHGLIADRRLFEALQQSYEGGKPELTYGLLYQSIVVKKTLVERDPLESNVRRALNFGHTIGHAIESVMLETGRPISHGNAVCVGMLAEAYLSWQSGLILIDHFEEVQRFLIRIYDPKELLPLDRSAIMRYMANDKKNDGNGINFSLINGIGSFSINKKVPDELIAESLDYLSV